MEQEISTIKAEFITKLEIEGINFQGYGIIPKAVMLDPDLTLEAKAIYAYFCSYAGAGNSSFPGRDKILDDLNVSIGAYYRHLKLLRDFEYLKIIQNRKGAYFKNTYILPQRLERYEIIKPIANTSIYVEKNFVQHEKYSMKAFGYGMIPKAVMKDPRLTLKAKGIYAYFCSYAGAGDFISKYRDQMLRHLGIGKDSYYKHLDLLKEYRYIQSELYKKEGNFYAKTCFILCEFPKSNVNKPFPPCINFPDTANNLENEQDVFPNSSCAKFQSPEYEDTGIEDTEILDNKSNSFKINSFKSNCSVSLKTEKMGSTSHFENTQTDGRNNLQKDKLQNIDWKSEIIKNNGIPYFFATQPDLLQTVIKNFLNYEQRIELLKDPIEKECLSLITNMIVNLCLADEFRPVKVRRINYAKFIDALNRTYDKTFQSLQLEDVAENVLKRVCKKIENDEIKSPTLYIASSLYDELLSDNFRLHANLRKDFGI